MMGVMLAAASVAMASFEDLGKHAVIEIGKSVRPITQSAIKACETNSDIESCQKKACEKGGYTYTAATDTAAATCAAPA